MALKCLSGSDSAWVLQALVAFTATLGIVSDGIHFGWSSPAIPVLLQEGNVTGISFTEPDGYYLEIFYWIGGLFGLPITVLAVDRLGRKNAILLASLQDLIAWIMIATAGHKEIMFAARVISGAAANTAFVTTPMYVAECADPKIRGFLGTFIYLMMMVGALTSYSLVPFVPLWASSLVGASINFVQIISFFRMPETPYYLLLKKKRDKSESSLKWLRNRDDVTEELKEIEKAVDRQSQERGRPKDLFLVPSNRRAILVMTLLNTTQHFCGYSVMTMNVQMIMHESGSTFSQEVSAILFGACMMLSLLVSSSLIDKFGRKVLLIVSCLLTALFLGMLAIYFFLKDYQHIDATNLKFVPLVAVLGYAFAYRIGLGLVPIVMTGEIFPTSVKAMGMTLADFVFILMAIFSIQLYYFTSSYFGMYMPFSIFCVCGVLTAVCVFLFVPETKGKTLEEIQMKLKRNHPSKEDKNPTSTHL